MFEYMTISSVFIDIEALNKLGQDGWELISVCSDMSNRKCAYFKRKIEV